MLLSAAIEALLVLCLWIIMIGLSHTCYGGRDTSGNAGHYWHYQRPKIKQGVI
jgi:hypothetical protein